MDLHEAWIERVLRVCDHVHAHLDEELEPGALAALAGLSVHHFHRVFRGMTGESLMGFVRRLRLERSAQRLKYGEAPVTELAFAAGYASHEAFTRAFHARFGVSPSSFRQRERWQPSEAVAMSIQEVPAREVIAMRHTGSYEACGQVWQELMQHAASMGWMPHLRESIGLCYDDPEVTEARHLRYDACLALAPELTPTTLPAGCVRRQVPGGRYACARARGPYDALLEVYVDLIGRWLPTRAQELADEPVVEVYRVSAWETADPADFETDVCVRIAS